MSATVWVVCHSHRARAALERAVPTLGRSWGAWPLGKDGKVTGWPRGEYYQVPAEYADACRSIKGATVMAGTPRGDLFKRWEA